MWDVDLRMRNTRTSLPNVLQGSVNKVGSGNTVMDDWRWNLLRRQTPAHRTAVRPEMLRTAARQPPCGRVQVLPS